MKKLITLMAVGVLFLSTSLSSTANPEFDKYELISIVGGEYTGYVNTVGSCGFSFKDSDSGYVFLLDNSGYGWSEGSHYTILVGGSGNCGPLVTSRTLHYESSY